MPNLRHRYQIRPEFDHRIFFTENALTPGNPILRNAILEEASTGAGEPIRVLACFDEGLSKANHTLAADIEHYFQAQTEPPIELVAPPLALPGGEACKNDWGLVETLWQTLNNYPLSRHSRVLVIGGGAVLDLVGFAVATAHRGMRLVRMPTTTLSQGDSGVGVKCGVNRFGQKNWVGAFATPWAVVNDFSFLTSQPENERRAGLAEALKVALVKSAEFFDWLEQNAASLCELEPNAVHQTVVTSARIHAEHIASGGDPYEMGEGRPLDFGHWAAHKLEQLSAFRLSHGEAVAVGMVIDLHYANRVGLLQKGDLARALSVAETMGLLDILSAPEVISELEAAANSLKAPLLQGFEEFRLHLGGQLCLCMVTAPGMSRDINVVDTITLQTALRDSLALAEAKTH